MIVEGDFSRKMNGMTFDMSQRYIAKSDPYTVMVSTHNDPGGLKGT
jgi:hypothetical protein